MTIDLNRNDFLYRGTIKLFKFYLLTIFVLTCVRVGFVTYFADASVYSEHFSDLLYSFFMGWRYDTIVASYCLILPYLLTLITSILKVRFLSNSAYFINAIYLFIMINVVTLLALADIGFYSYFQDHINILFFGILEDDTKALAETIWKNYPIEYAILGYAAFVVGLVFLFKHIFKFMHRRQRSFIHKGFFKFNFINIFILVLLLGGARGGYGILVLSPKYADFSVNPFINQAAVNGVIMFERALKLRRQRTSSDFNMAKAMGYPGDIHEAFSDYLGFDTTPTKTKDLIFLLQRKTPENEVAETIKPHVIVLLMESFGAHWREYNEDKFNFMGDLESHFAEDFYFNNFISSDNGTIGSLMALGTNIPNRPGARFLSESRYMQIPLGSAANIPFKQKGYETNFLYGGKLGWRDIGKYFTYQGFHNVEGESHIKKSQGLKGLAGTEWGLYDEHFFSHIYAKLASAKRPQFIYGLSTSNHPPFEVPTNFEAQELIIPDNLKLRIAREEDHFIQRFKSFQYVNFKLAELITKIKNSDLGKNTIIAVTGDHNFWSFINYKKEESFIKNTVPFYLYVPKGLRPATYDADKYGSHEDIMPTLYNLALSETPYLAFGEDLFSDADSFSMNGSSFASKEGYIMNGKHYIWDSEKKGLIKPLAVETPFPLLDKAYRSTLTISDFYLRSLLQK